MTIKKRTINILLISAIAIIALFLLQFEGVGDSSLFSTPLTILVRINIILGAFNLIPIPPLDGSKIVMSLLPQDAQQSLARLEPYGFFILVLLLFTGVLDPVIRFMQNIIIGFITVLFSLF